MKPPRIEESSARQHRTLIMGDADGPADVVGFDYLHPICSPACLIRLFGLRFALGLSSHGVSCDYFVWREATDSGAGRPTTRIGGVPYLAARRGWPLMNGRELAFVGQVSFVDSLDLVDVEPGVALVFGRSAGLFEDLLCVWQPIVATEPLLQKVGVQQSARPHFEGVRCRSTEYSWHPEESLHDEVMRNAGVRFLAHEVLRPQATKIGGFPSARCEEVVPDGAVFLAEIATIQPPGGVRWPLAGREPALDHADTEPLTVEFDSMGSLCIFRERSGHIGVALSLP